MVELSEPTCPELKETIHSVVHGLLATLSPKMHSKVPPLENTATGMVNIWSKDCAELVENTSLHFQPQISLTRDYLARLLFWLPFFLLSFLQCVYLKWSLATWILMVSALCFPCQVHAVRTLS